MSESGWLAEPPLLGWQQRFQVTARLYETHSSYQRIEIWDTVPFGRALVLDGAVQTTEQDEFIYHEMLVHVALFGHPAPRRVLVVGGGDGGCLRRVLEHPVERAVQVEIDREVVDTCKTWLPSIAERAFEDPRGQLVIDDAMAYLERPGEPFDVILVDSTDPVGAATPLFTDGFYRAATARLRPNGLLVTQSGSPLLMPDELKNVVGLLSRHVGPAAVYVASIPSYPGVLWSFAAASLGGDVHRPSPRGVSRRASRAGIHARYYTPELQRAAFVLPAFVEQLIKEPGDGDARPPIRPLFVESPVR